VEEYSSMPLAFPHGLAMWHSWIQIASIEMAQVCVCVCDVSLNTIELILEKIYNYLNWWQDCLIVVIT
jgi:hypothetical protein